MNEGGNSADYTHPGKSKGDPYFKLPHTYWTDGWCKRLKLPAKAMLLVCLSMRPGFYLPLGKVPEWYGFSEDTAQRGMQQLVEEGLLTYKSVSKKAPLTPLGFTTERRYTLMAPFSLEA